MSKFESNIKKIYAFKFFSGMHLFAAVLVPFFTDWGHITLTQVMILQSWFMLWIFLLEVPTGTVADYLGRKYSLMLAMLIGIIAVLVYGSIPNFYIFLIGEVLFAASAALISGADEAFIYDTLKKTKQTKESKIIYGRAESFSMAGILAGSLIGGFAAAGLGLNAPMLLTSIPVFVSFLITLTLKEPKTTKKIESKRYIHILKEGVTFFYKHKILKILAFDMISVATVAYFMIWLYQPVLKNAGFNIAYFGVVHAALVIVEILIMNNFTSLEKIFGSKKNMLFCSAILTGAGFIIISIAATIPIIILGILLGGGFGLSRTVLFSSYLNKFIPSAKRATILSAVSMLRRFALVIINPMVGFLADWSIKYTLIIVGVSGMILAFISRVEEKHLAD